jgi:hypothetical protein
MKRPLRLLLAVALSPVALATCYYGYENWTGFLEWQQARSALIEDGEPLRIDSLRPGALADEDNMATAPVFREFFTLGNLSKLPLSEVRLPSQNGPGSEPAVRVIRLAHRFEESFSGDTRDAAQVVLNGLAPFEPVLDALAAAANRPEAIWPVALSPDRGFQIPVLPPLLRSAEVFSARGVAALAAGDHAAAAADFDIITRLATRSNDPPLMAGCMASARILDQAVSLVEQGLLLDAWTDDDLRHISQRLAGQRPLDTFRDSLRGERALFFEFSDEMTEQTAPMFTIIDFRSKLAEHVTRTFCTVLWKARPSGWANRDRAAYARLSQEWLTLVIHRDFIRPWALASWHARLREIRRDPLLLFQMPVTATTLPTFASAARSAAYAQTRIDLARIACAIELHRRQTGRLPADLATLSPGILRSIPRDVVGGGKYAYRPTGARSYVLYGRGWNGRDDGGTAGGSNPLLGPPSAKDWVWETGRLLTADSTDLNPTP